MGKLDRLNSLLHKSGFELTRYDKSTNGILRRKAIFKKYGVDLVIDVGANTGIYGKEIRQAGYHGEIVSFEPLTDAYEKLLRNTKEDTKWKTYNCALGLENGRQIINVSANSHSSSILEILDTHIQAEATASYVGQQEINVNTLDSIFNEIRGTAVEIFLKIDTQGFELNVLKGAANCLNYIHTIQLEMSLRPLYDGQPLYNDLLGFLHFNEYRLIDVEPGFTDLKTGTLFQFDGIFRKTQFIV
jgi:FkbM family methyltransferase